MSEADLQAYVRFYEGLTPSSLGRFVEVMTEDARFVDPFNDVTGIEKIEAIFAHMFENLKQVRFTVKHAAIAADDTRCALLSWELSSLMNGKPWQVTGMSEIRFAADGRVSQHIDHWDAGRQFYERLPIVGWLFAGIRKRLQVP